MIKDLLALLHNWAYQLGKNIHLDLPLPVINYLRLEANKDDKDTVMVKPYEDIDINRLYLPFQIIFKNKQYKIT